ncbi:MAG: hypothetical protein NC342_03330 [Pseudoflavonifractor sp.]|nr:hypothetical protein [Alloprevotella sp.]MCM1116547.1 hypothetical protein [Pseudoflavonifractor sp.]
MSRALPLIILAALIAAPMAHGKKRVTTRPKLERISGAAAADVAVADSLPLDSIILSGYDKPLRSRSETLFVTNSSSRRLISLTIVLDYSDLQGRQLHQMTLERGVDIPAGATRQITFTSWDRQMTFVYLNSRRSARSRGIPFTVTAVVTGARMD